MNNTIVTITIDDGYKCTFNSIFKFLKDLSIKTTWFLVSKSIGGKLENSDVIDIDDIRKLCSIGSEFGSHTLNHPFFILSFNSFINVFKNSVKEILKHKTYNQYLKWALWSKFKKEAKESKSFLENVLNSKIKSFAYPYGIYSKYFIGVLKDLGYASARTTDDGFNEYKNINPYRLKTKVITKKTTLNEMNEWVDEALKNNLWLIETYHLIYGDIQHTDYLCTTILTQFKKHILYIIKKNIPIMTQTEVIKYLQKF